MDSRRQWRVRSQHIARYQLATCRIVVHDETSVMQGRGRKSFGNFNSRFELTPTNKKKKKSRKKAALVNHDEEADVDLPDFVNRLDMFRNPLRKKKRKGKPDKRDRKKRKTSKA